MKLWKLLVALAVLAGAFAAELGPSVAQTQTKVNALVMVVSNFPETMARNVPIHRRVVSALSETLVQRGINIYDAERLGAQYMNPTQTRYGDDELLSIARAIGSTTPLDVVVFVEIVAEVTRDTFRPQIQTPRVRMPARVLNIRTAQLVTAFEVDVQRLPVLPTPCDPDCLMNAVGNDSKLIAADLGEALHSKLQGWNGGGVRPVASGGTIVIADGSPNAPAEAPAAAPAAAPACEGLSGDFQMMFRDFRADELMRIADALRLFSCYEEMRPVRTGETYAEYFYKTSAGAMRLESNLRNMVVFLQVPAQVRFDGARYEIVRIQTRK